MTRLSHLHQVALASSEITSGRKLARVVPIMNSTQTSTCTPCALRELCLPYGLSDKEMEHLAGMVSSHRKIKRGMTLYNVGERFQSLYAVRTGFFKCESILEDGRSQVTGFRMAGELLGMDGIGNDAHNCNAIALEDSEVCVMPFAQIENYSQEIRTLQNHLHRILSREIIRDQEVMMLLGAMRAEERLAAFLLNLSQRFAERGYAANEFHLRMTRDEIGSFLGLKLETVSRTLSHFQDTGLIKVQHKHLRILDPDALRGLINNRARQ